jgi:hypothetical protein
MIGDAHSSRRFNLKALMRKIATLTWRPDNDGMVIICQS